MRKPHTCKYCDFASVHACNLRRHVETDTWENNTHLRKTHTCNYYDFASVQSCDLRRLLKSFNCEIWHICNYCDFASIQAGDLRRSVKTNIRENHTHGTIVTLHLFNHANWEDFWNHLIAKFGISVTIVTLHLFKQAIWEDIWKLTFEKTTHMELLWLYICSNRQFEKTCEN